MTTKFETGKTYFTPSICDQNCIFRITVAGRTEKTLVTTEGKRLRISTRDGIESVMPTGRYSMAPCIKADREYHIPGPTETGCSTQFLRDRG